MNYEILFWEADFGGQIDDLRFFAQIRVTFPELYITLISFPLEVCRVTCLPFRTSYPKFLSSDPCTDTVGFVFNSDEHAKRFRTSKECTKTGRSANDVIHKGERFFISDHFMVTFDLADPETLGEHHHV